MTTRLEIPITTLADGTCLLTVVSNSATFNANGGVNGTNLPFASVSSGSSTLPFAVYPSAIYSPFVTQAANITTFGIDSIQIDFLET